jgi:hypothetical protein
MLPAPADMIHRQSSVFFGERRLPDVITNETIRVTRGSDGSERLAGVMASVSYLLFIYVRPRESPPIPPEADFR